MRFKRYHRKRECDGLPLKERQYCLTQHVIGVLPLYGDVLQSSVKQRSDGTSTSSFDLSAEDIVRLFDAVPWLGRDNTAVELPPDPYDAFDALKVFAASTDSGNNIWRANDSTQALLELIGDDCVRIDLEPIS